MLPISTTAIFGRRSLRVILFVVLVGLIYFNSLNNGFLFDDPHYIVQNYLIKALDSQALWELFSSFYVGDYIPLTLFSLAIDYWLYGLNPIGYHFSNTLLHLINSLLVYQLFLKITRSERGAFWISLIFLVHPVQVESVAWISERKNLLSFSFLALSFLSYLRGGTRPLSLLLFFLACLAKTSVVILPLLLILYDVSFSRKHIKDIVVGKVPYFLISLGVVILTLSSQSHEKMLTVFSMMAVVKEYIFKMLFPLNLNIWYPAQVYKSLMEPQVLISILVLAGYFWLIRWSYSNQRIVFFGLVWFLIALLPVSHIIPFPQMMADRYLYIPGLGLIIVFVTLIPASNKGKSLLAFSVILMFSLLSINRNKVYQDDLHLWQNSVATNPNNTRSVMYLGLSYWGKGDQVKALEMLTQAQILEPKNYRAALYSAHIHTQRQEWKKAQFIYRELIQKNPERPIYYNDLAAFLGNRDQIKESLSLLNKALELDPDYAKAHFNRGIFLDKMGDSQGALRAYQKAVALEPKSDHYQYVMGMFYLQRTDHPERGRKHLKLSLRLNPDQPSAETIRQTLNP
jgi:protein O-mannosyl-transferase